MCPCTRLATNTLRRGATSSATPITSWSNDVTASSLKRWLREPLLHFLVAGALLFAGFRALHPEFSVQKESNRIDVTADDIRQLEIVWTAQWHRPPTGDEMRGLIENRVKEEILYRE